MKIAGTGIITSNCRWRSEGTDKLEMSLKWSRRNSQAIPPSFWNTEARLFSCILQIRVQIPFRTELSPFEKEHCLHEGSSSGRATRNKVDIGSAISLPNQLPSPLLELEDAVQIW